MTTRIVAFRNFVKASQNSRLSITTEATSCCVRTATCDGSETQTVRKNGSNTATAQLCWRELGRRAGK